MAAAPDNLTADKPRCSCCSDAIGNLSASFNVGARFAVPYTAKKGLQTFRGSESLYAQGDWAARSSVAEGTGLALWIKEERNIEAQSRGRSRSQVQKRN